MVFHDPLNRITRCMISDGSYHRHILFSKMQLNPPVYTCFMYSKDSSKHLTSKYLFKYQLRNVSFLSHEGGSESVSLPMTRNMLSSAHQALLGILLCGRLLNIICPHKTNQSQTKVKRDVCSDNQKQKGSLFQTSGQ